MISTILYSIALIFIARIGFRLYQLVIEYRSKFDPDVYGKGSWAAITGSTDGIGKGFAFYLASQGFNIVLFGRSEEKLTAVRDEIIKTHNVQVKTINKDFTKSGEKGFFESIRRELEALDVSILVNNVGIATTLNIGKDSDEKAMEMVAVNCISQTVMSNIVVVRMNERKKRSAIVSLSSILGIRYNGIAPIYNATKIFNSSLSMSTENSGSFQNIDFLAIHSSLVLTKIAPNPDTYLTSTVEECVEGSLKGIGKVPYTYGSTKSAITGIFLEVVYYLFPGKLSDVLFSLWLRLTMRKNSKEKKN